MWCEGRKRYFNNNFILVNKFNNTEDREEGKGKMEEKVLGRREERGGGSVVNDC